MTTPSDYPVHRPPPPDQPQAVTAMVLGILGLLLCGLLSPFAWVMGKRSMREIDDSQGAVGGRTYAQIGYITGLVGSILLIGALVLGLLALIVAIIAAVANT